MSMCEMWGVTCSCEGPSCSMYIIRVTHSPPNRCLHFSPSPAVCWLSLTIHLHHWSGGFKPWLWQATVALLKGAFRCNVGDGDRRLSEEHLYMYVCAHLGNITAKLSPPPESFMSRLSVVSQPCQLQLVRWLVLTLSQSVIESDKLPTTDLSCHSETLKKVSYTRGSGELLWASDYVIAALMETWCLFSALNQPRKSFRRWMSNSPLIDWL